MVNSTLWKVLPVFVLIIPAAWSIPGCRAYKPGAAMAPQRPIQAVIRDVRDQWIQIPGVVAVAQGQEDGAPCILVLCTAEPAQVRTRLPASIEGYPVIVRHTDQIKALD
ncbi:MAG: hypothetical protein QHH07_10480 [Sedimentisphaerales bacterium]|jgi:hypothetical protein|nr:hypothetical protein [Sedimentisphaerales bacterium]